ncbi:MAG TPA: tripartite tricarboxylate transporter substrate binding protein [Burkholderiales bacterium]|nr:tripartite tricarboxylate transporter substrate binding protein [Burkholderiales bacterium]
MNSTVFRCTAGLVLAACAGLVPAGGATAQNYPSRPIRLIVPFPPGGGTDITARATALKLGESWGQTVVVDNRPGANGTIGADIAAKSAPDGYTITMISSSHAVNAGLYSKLPYDLMRDLTPITQATSQPYVLVINPSVPAKSVKELLAVAKAKPGTLNYGSSGTGGISHLAGALLGSLTGTSLVHVPYKGGNPAMIDVISGQIQMLFGTLLLNGPHIKAGRLRVLAVTTPQRWPGTPELPTMVEAGVPGFVITQWYGMLAPARTPQAIVTRLNKEIARILHQPDVQEKLAADGADAVGNTPEQFGAHIRSEIAKYSKLVKQIGLKAE